MKKVALLILFLTAFFASLCNSIKLRELADSDSSISDVEGDSDFTEFINFLKDFAKTYLSFTEIKKRFTKFKQNLKQITHFNSAKSKFKCGYTKFTDALDEEISQILNLEKPDITRLSVAPSLMVKIIIMLIIGQLHNHDDLCIYFYRKYHRNLGKSNYQLGKRRKSI
jgi:hypothetical protein